MTLAGWAGVNGHRRLASTVAGGEIGKAVFELGLELAKGGDLVARLRELLQVDLAKLLGGGGGGARAFLLAHEPLNFREREAEVLELGDPAHAEERILGEQAVATLGALVRLEQAELLVKVDGSHGL